MLRATLLASALRYAEHGMYVHPLRVGAKEPLWGRWEERATRDPELIRHTWSRAPFNIGVACGRSRLVAVDLDVPHANETSGIPGVVDGWTMLETLAARASKTITPTFAVRTPSGGRHLIYRSPAHTPVRNSARTVGWCIDTRAAGGYVVGIGSVVDGATYVLDSSTTDVAVLPDWLLTLITTSPMPPKAGGGPRQAEVVGRLRALARQGNREQRWAAGILRSECDELAAMTEPGGRNNRLNLAAYRAGQLVGAGLLDQAVAEEQLTEAARACGLGADTPHEIERTLRSGMTAGLSRPRRMATAPVRRIGGAA
ncbi:bifunctional DNA primase/polymerase [Streptomyces albus]|uniref:bifunctional DNA primase/polymerase n=1 Tax=Streptomyces albus TaxID=1888 RepID=UPI0033CF1641